MADTGLHTQFKKISDQANAAIDELEAASTRTRDQLEADAAKARDRASAAANQLKQKSAGAREKVSSQSQDIRAKWQAHVAQVRTKAKEKKQHLDAKTADADANMAESYALDTIDIAQAAIEEAEYATLDAMAARASADALRT